MRATRTCDITMQDFFYLGRGVFPYSTNIEMSGNRDNDTDEHMACHIYVDG